jgi:hypothetical protein
VRVELENGGYAAKIHEYRDNNTVAINVTNFGIFEIEVMNIGDPVIREKFPVGTEVDVVVFDNAVTSITIPEEE